MNPNTSDRIKLVAISFLLVSVIAGITIYFSQRGSADLKAMPENAAVKTILEEEIAKEANGSDIVSIRMIPKQGQTGRNLSGRLAGSLYGSFTYEVVFTNQDSIIVTVRWHRPKDAPPDGVVVEGFRRST